jgi:PIN domain nuclease of toxin-antitoxin system
VTRILLDTHVFLWWAKASSYVRAAWLEQILDEGNEVFVSAASAWEIETKKRIKKLDFDDDVAHVASEFGFDPLSVTMEHATLAGALDWEHRDPFDRMLVAQAVAEQMLLISADEAMRSAPGVRVL